MKNDLAFYIKKNRHLTLALIISGALNIGILTFFSYWVARERPPTPYFELKPAAYDQEQVPLADQRDCLEVVTQLQPLSIEQLFTKLNSPRHIENGFKERDLALTTLVAFHHFDLARALANPPKETRILKWRHPMTGEVIPLTIYPGLKENDFDSIIAFSKTEKWPLTSQGLFNLLQKQNEEQNIDPSLAETFLLAPEFLTIELLFNRADVNLRKQKLLEMILEGNWDYLQLFVEQQKQINDLSLARRQKLLLDYIKQESETAAYLFLEIEGETAIKKLDDNQVIALLQLLPNKTKESEHFALNLLISPRSTSVLQQASLRLYEYEGEPIPKDWNYKTSLARFIPEKAKTAENDKTETTSSKPTPPIVVKINNEIITKKDLASAQNKKELAKTPPKAIAQASPPKTTPSSGQYNSKPQATTYRSYIVQEGDSLWKISRRFGVDMEVLKKQNKLKTIAIKPGTVLRIP